MFGGMTDRDVELVAAERAKRAYLTGFKEGVEGGNDEPVLYDAAGKAISTGYRAYKATKRDISQVANERANQSAYRVWNTNPLAKALIEIVVDYVIGEGPELQVYNEEVEEALDLFWNDPVNDFASEGTEMFTREFILFGEQLLIAFVRTGEDVGAVADGRLRLGPVDPNQIGSIITHPENRKDVYAVRLKDENGVIEDGPLYKVIKAEAANEPLSGQRDLQAYKGLVDHIAFLQERGADARISETAMERRGVYRHLKEGREWKIVEQENGNRKIVNGGDLKNVAFDGECFLWQTNRMSTGVRGRSVLLPLIDWLDRYDQLFFDGSEHVALINSFVWDLTVEGGEIGAPEPERNLTYQANVIRGAKPNSVYAHNEKAKLEPKNPDLKTPDLETIIRALRVFIAGGMRIPEHWIAEGGYTNRATAKEMGEPTHKMLTRMQAMVRRSLTEMCQYQIDVKVAMGLIPEEVQTVDEDGEPAAEPVKARDAFDIVMPEIAVSETEPAARAFELVAAAVQKLVISKMLPLKPAVQMIASVAKMFGVEIDVDKVVDSIQGEQEETAVLADLIDQIERERARRAGDNGQGEEEGEFEREPELGG
jgi:hypothetical protein